MIEFLLSILSSIIGNLLTPSFKERTGLKNNAPPPLPLQPQQMSSSSEEEALQRRRQYVREQWKIRGWSMFVLFVLIFFVGTALAIPASMKTSFFTKPLACDDIRAVTWCAGSYWETDSVKEMLIPLTFACAIVIWFLAQLLADPISNAIHYNHTPVGPILYRRILGLTIMFLAFLLCGHWIYFLFPKFSYGISLVLPFAAIGLAGAAMSSQG